MLLSKASKYTTTWWRSARKGVRTESVSKAQTQARSLSSLAKQRHAKPFAKRFARTVMTTSDAEDTRVEKLKDMRGLNKTVEFLMGVPETQLARKVVIYKPTPRTTQSGTKHTQVYMKYVRANNRLNEPLMGWTATEDPTGNLTLTFQDSDSAIAFAQRNGLEYELLVHEGQERNHVPRDYAVNFKFRDPKKVHNEDVDL